jgi:cephalosporin hydroxylase
MKAHNALVKALRDLSPRSAFPLTTTPDLLEVMKWSREPGAISDHLVTIYLESLKVRPRLIVELGVRGGSSTRVFGKVARRNNAVIISVDIQDCLQVIDHERWHFVRSDDIEFADQFESWCMEKRIKPAIDLLFVDTSHVYGHTVLEIHRWFPYLSSESKVIFHDTNMGEIYRKRDGSLATGWDNSRGVIKAIEEYFGVEFNEEKGFVELMDGWLISHSPYSSGLTVMERV